MGFKKFMNWARPGNYIRELSVVILGVFITLTASTQLTTCSKKKEYRQIIEMVHAELVENKEVVDLALYFAEEQYEKMVYFHDMSDHIDQIPMDTLDTYSNIFRREFPFILTNHTFELMKYSSAIHSNHDVKVIRDIMAAYDYGATCQYFLDLYRDGLRDMVDNLDSQVDRSNKNLTERYARQYTSQIMNDYLNTTFPSEVFAICRRASNKMGDVIKELESKYRIKDTYRFEYYPEPEAE